MTADLREGAANLHGVELSVKLGGLTFQNPILTASGCFGYGTEYEGLVAADRLGGICTKGLSVLPRPGNPPPRIAETAAGMLNAIGLENIGIEAFIRDKAPLLAGSPTRVVANLFGVTIDEYVELCLRCDDVERIDAVELNISCPNVKAGGVEFGIDAGAAGRVTAAARAATKKPLWVKLSPNAGDRIVEVARACWEAGADALTLINTISGMAIDLENRRPVLANRSGGLSGPAIKPIALRMVDLVHRRLPEAQLVGIGGIATWQDAAQFLLAGASAVQVGTAIFSDPGAPERIVEGLARYCADQGIARLADLTGALRG